MVNWETLSHKHHHAFCVVPVNPLVQSPRSRRQLSLVDSALFLTKWLFLPLQLLIIDGQQLRSDPAAVMDGVQKFLGVTPRYNYSEALT